VYEVGLRGSQFSYAAAIGLFNTLVNVTLLVIVNLVSKKLADVSIF
jgi:putative aldouronate transport system permease protein